MQTPEQNTTAAAGQPASPMRLWINPPPIGAVWADAGGVYAGMARGNSTTADYVLVLSGEQPNAPLTWQAAQDWAAALRTAGHDDWSVPTRAESALLFANVRETLRPGTHWTRDTFWRHYAWAHSYGNGGQNIDLAIHEFRARAVRRLCGPAFSRGQGHTPRPASLGVATILETTP